MKIKIIILLLITSIVISKEEEITMKNFINNGRLDAMIENTNDNIYLVQIDVKNDSLLNLALLALPNLEFFGGPASYHRLLNNHHIESLSKYLTKEHYKILDNNYKIPKSRDYWTLTLQGNQYYSASGETNNSCMCIDGSDCVIVGFNDSWYNPLDYDGEVTWDFTPPYFDEIEEARVTIAGVQCDDLPLWSETTMSVRNNDCNWSDFQTTLGWEYTINGPYVFSGDILNNIWCNGNLQPLVQSQDNYSVDWVRVELYYTCNAPSNPTNFNASNDSSCDYVELNWSEYETIMEYSLYRDNDLIITLNSEQTQYLDYSAESDTSHEYCLYAINQCGESAPSCTYGSKKTAPLPSDNINASNEYIDYIIVDWNESATSTHYNLFRDSFLLSVIPLGQELVYTDQFVDQDVVYEYCIEPNNECGPSTWTCGQGSLSIANLGDLNMDQQIDILDIVLLVNFILEIQSPDENEEWLSDLNLDGLINILDVVMIVNFILGNE